MPFGFHGMVRTSGLMASGSTKATGTGVLYHAGVRVYDSETGRFLSQDPLGLSAASLTDADDVFGYAGQNPIGKKDSTGYCPTTEPLKPMRPNLQSIGGGGAGVAFVDGSMVTMTSSRMTQFESIARSIERYDVGFLTGERSRPMKMRYRPNQTTTATQAERFFRSGCLTMMKCNRGYAAVSETSAPSTDAEGSEGAEMEIISDQVYRVGEDGQPVPTEETL